MEEENRTQIAIPKTNNIMKQTFSLILKLIHSRLSTEENKWHTNFTSSDLFADTLL